MTRLTDSELTTLLRGNPDLVVEGNLIASRDLGGTSTNAAYVRNAPISEHNLQAAIIKRCDERSVLIVEYGLIFAIPNGQYRQGQRMEPGLRPGVPDLMIPVARQGWHGMFIELKCGDNKPKQNQLEWASKLKAEGYRCIVVWDSVEAAMLEIESYLEG